MGVITHEFLSASLSSLILQGVNGDFAPYVSVGLVLDGHSTTTYRNSFTLLQAFSNSGGLFGVMALFLKFCMSRLSKILLY